MRSAICVAALLYAATAAASDGGVAPGGPEVVGARVAPSVVRLADMVRGKQVAHGSGFFVSDDIVVTNHHVIDEVEGHLVAVFADGKELRVLGKLADDEARDLALLRVDGKRPSLPLAPSNEIHIGQRAIAVGSPLGFDQTVSSGIVSALRDGYPADLVELEADLGKKKGPLVQHTAPIAPGSSGGPLLDDQGRVIGVNHSKFGQGEINFAAHVDALRFVLAHTHLDASPEPVGANVLRNLYISAAVVAAILLAWFIGTRVAQRRQRRS